MADDFKSYLSGKGTRASEQGGKRITEKDIKKVKQNFSDGEIKNAESFVKRHEGKSESELMRELTDMAVAEKRNGTLSSGDLQNFAKNIAPVLDANQRRKLNQILAKLQK